ncbi:DNA-directed RNA polymerase subunit beta [Gemmatimonas sp.]|uniref:DNA-directed RNA polymerase subunit beta n=1 Tax=Gemmatimonas sp. TaxID=1962908 RepID=UPI0022C6213F|nr:DNA-directed RNA polymerase subunit beta [Gemmatimonas sp.]MCA2993086.1 DNA-directed RNA polymerase subunit beta [Gemmatimonas sp.]MCZ8012884.1 DNA-directed RNA polymerase subunit beta [Gemmatimonas sp.]MCZ8268259.1 DNA-directed RNA polymerase subunit beta [Gemmatimonas sp.]
MNQISFAKLETGMDMPHLLDIQTRAFESLLQLDAAQQEREDVGLERVFKDLFPITDVHENFSLEFVRYSLGEPKYTVAECIERDMTYSAPLKATLQLVIFEDTGDGKRPRNIIEKEVYLGELPLLTELGTFVINGAERVIVSQLHRSPGVVFEESTHPNGQRLLSSRIIPFRGSWVEFTVDIHDVIYVHIDKKKKFPATALLRAFGYGENRDILRLFFAERELDLTKKRETRNDIREVLGAIIAEDITLEGEVTAEDAPKPKTKKAKAERERNEAALLVREGDELTEEVLNRLVRQGVKKIKVFASYTQIDLRDEQDAIDRGERDVRRTLARDVIDADTGEVVADKDTALTDAVIKKIRKADIVKVFVFVASGRAESTLIKNTLAKDPTKHEEEALKQIYALLRPGDAPNRETAKQALERLFFSPKRYDLGRVGRYKINQRLRLNTPMSTTVLTKDDFVEIMRQLVELHEGRGDVDDIDQLGNRRIRSVGELIANQFSVGLSRMARLVKERMSINTDPEKISLDDLVNARTVSAVIQAFFGSSQLSQFMDQTNPLAELTHKRRLSALGPGGLTRERAGFEVRDVHYSQYGRMCPIETPEGPNIGLITSLACFARVNDLGFIETPYRIVKDGRVTGEIVWLDANREEDAIIAQANSKLNPDGTFVDGLVLSRKRGDLPLVPPTDIDYMDVAPEQLVSIAAALIPFLEHDDANRALMGSNMQRQAVPLLNPATPLVGTGLEATVAVDSGAVIIARRAGIVTSVTADEIIVDAGLIAGAVDTDRPLARLGQLDRYKLKKYWRTNQDTAINQRPLVTMGQQVAKGEVLADGAATEMGQLALGRNVTVAFMPWYGHNFEDAIVLSERLVKFDVFSSIHIQELELHVRDTKRGQEEITREIPNVAEESLVDLDERGIVRIGAQVKPGDILVGKITPKGETELSPEEKLLTAIFGEKAKDVKDSSLKVPPGMEGTVIDVKIFSRVEDQVVEKDRGERIGEVRRLEGEEKIRVNEVRDAELATLLTGETIQLALKAGTVEEAIPAGTVLTAEMLAGLRFATLDLKTFRVEKKAANERVREIIDAANEEKSRIEERAEERIDRILQPDELPPGVIQLVKVYLAEKRKISVGDKMAGRHGNKGIVARIVPEEDMPFLPNGRPVDIVLNPLGVPSRMNVGQILETHLGWAAKLLNFYAKTPVFEGANEREIGLLLKLAGLRWARETLVLGAAASDATPAEVKALLADIKPDRRLPDKVELLADANLNDLNAKGMSPETKALFSKVKGFVTAAARTLAERETAAVQAAIAVHRAGDELPGDATAASAAAAIASLEAEAALSPADTLRRIGQPALAALLAGDSDVDAAAAELIRLAGLTPTGKAKLRDGRTGEFFTSPVTVGEIYMLKLSHLVDDKIHARSIGPYSLVTQQPLAGKAQFGGQRFGEMEVWALEAYGAAHTLQEILTVKSDDVNGRSRVYEAIVKGQNLPEPGIPESFNVLVKELQALGIKVTLGASDGTGVELIDAGGNSNGGEE